MQLLNTIIRVNNEHVRGELRLFLSTYLQTL